MLKSNNLYFIFHVVVISISKLSPGERKSSEELLVDTSQVIRIIRRDTGLQSFVHEIEIFRRSEVPDLFEQARLVWGCGHAVNLFLMKKQFDALSIRSYFGHKRRLEAGIVGCLPVSLREKILGFDIVPLQMPICPEPPRGVFCQKLVKCEAELFVYADESLCRRILEWGMQKYGAWN